ncbi:MAG: hypothetical protein KAS21_02210 [Candidatus Aminicenantes bacterium]|nr:hypothetical protein [Candidatus Aminicenantes bacterium]
MKNSRGLTVLELLSAVTIGMFILTSSFPIISSFLSRIEISTAVSSITTHLSEARYLSLAESRKVRFRIVNRSGRLEIINNHKWINHKSWEIKGKINITCNASPVFNPKGSASPMCTIKISNKMYSYKITLSFAGRIRITKL